MPEKQPIPPRPIDKLRGAIRAIEVARDCVRQNRGMEKEEAIEALDYSISEVLIPAVQDAVEDIQKDRSVEAIARFVLKKMEAEK